jgi:Leucine-rich repeat (LRR) protein
LSSTGQQKLQSSSKQEGRPVQLSGSRVTYSQSALKPKSSTNRTATATMTKENPPQQKETPSFNDLPDEPIQEVMSYLNPKDMAHLSQTNKRMHQLARNTQAQRIEEKIVLDLDKISAAQFATMRAPYKNLEIRHLNSILQLEKLVQNFPNLQKLAILESKITDLTPLQGLTNLTDLTLQDLPNVTDLTPLQGLTKLTHLALWGLNFADLALLQGLTNLKELSLCCLSKVITDLTPLQERLTNLTRLGLWGLNVTDFTFLRGLTNLKELFWGLDADLTLLQGLTNLTYLGLNHLNVTDLTPLLKLPLKELSLAELGSKGVSRQILLKMPFLKEVRFYYLDKERKQELTELLKQKPSFKIFYDDRLINPQESSWEDFD